MFRSSFINLALPSYVPAIWVAGLNWHSHAAEVGFPIPQQPIFCMKSPTSLLYPQSLQFTESNDPRFFAGKFGNKIHIPRSIQLPPEVDYEGELAVVIGGRFEQGELKTKEDVLKNQDQVVAGFTCAMDITARRWQGKKGGGQWCIAKSFDSFCPLGPDLVKFPLEQLPNLALTTKLNGKVVQHEKFNNFIFDVATLISFLNQVSTLLPGMVLLTGTPAGVGFARKTRVRGVGDGLGIAPNAAESASGADRSVPDPYYLIHGDRLEVIIDQVGSLRCIAEFEGREGEGRLPI
jgi:2-keto-4-pentenoate hydratase/2-oxohepta-3-ene-1,7-dioic acid hydratase in catechol pathway